MQAGHEPHAGAAVQRKAESGKRIVQIRRFLMLTNTRMLVAMGLLAGRKSVAAIQRGLAIDGKYGRNLGRTLGLSERESGAPSPSRPP